MAKSPTIRLHWWLGALVATILILTLLALQERLLNWNAKAPETLRVGAYDGDVAALAWIAQEQGYFVRANLHVDMRGFATGKESVEALRTGQVDLAMASEFVVADRSFEEADLRILAAVCRYWNKGLIGRRDLGIASAADLKGKRIGVTITSTAEHTLLIFLAMQGLTMKDVQPTNLAPRQLVDRLMDGGIDAAITWQPHVDVIERRLGANAVSLMDSGSDAYLVALTQERLVTEKTEAFKRFLGGLVQAENWIRDDPARAKRWLANHFALDADYVETLWPRMHLAVNLPQELLEVMDGEARWLAKRKGKAGMPNFSTLLATKPLTDVRPSAVSVFDR